MQGQTAAYKTASKSGTKTSGKQSSKLKTTKFVKKAFNTAGTDALVRIIPIIIAAFVFTLTTNITLSSMGMVTFWGIVVAIIYSIIITKTLYNANED